MGLLFKHHLHAQKEEDIEFERRQRRREENNQRFQEMLLKILKIKEFKFTLEITIMEEKKNSPQKKQNCPKSCLQYRG